MRNVSLGEKVGLNSLFKKQHKIRFGILVIFVGLLIVSLALTTTYTRWNIQSAIDSTSQDLITKTQKSIMDDTLAYFTPAMSIMELGARVESVSDRHILDSAPLFAFLKGSFDALPQSSLIFAADEDGNLLSISKVPEKRVLLYTPDRPIPHGSAFVVDVVDRRNGYHEWRSYVNAQGQEIGREYRPPVAQGLEYDNRKRDWYVRTKELGKSNWSNVYASWFSTQFVITASVPLKDSQGRFFGVLACDIGIEQLSHLLAKQKASRSGLNFIINDRDELVSFPDVNETYVTYTDPVTKQESVRLAKVTQMGDTAISNAYELYKKNRLSHFRYERDDIEYVAHFSHFPGTFSRDWTLGLLAPYDDFVGPIRETSQDVLMISLLILVVSIILLIVFAQKISYPIETLAGHMRRMKDLDLDAPSPLNSQFAEITQMENALNAMREGLSAFGKFVPKTLVRTLVQQGGNVMLGGERRKLTIMFSDIESFTSVSEKMESGALMNHLSNYMSELSDIILAHKGTIDKFIGDAIMSFWGAPEKDPKNAQNACKAALLCVHHLAELNRKWEASKLPRLNTRFGIDYGEVIVGNMGSSDRMNYTVIGDHVNLASRLEGINKLYATTICVSESVYKEIKKTFLTRPMDIVAVKGKEKGVHIFELVAQLGEDPLLKATPEQVEWCQITTHAFEKYLHKDWEGAIKLYEKVLLHKPADPLSLLYIERCRALIAHPPEGEWSPIQRMHTK
ncbi:MAG: hypothetical protein LCH26_03185 [Proteobacteria bacterium]|nr:hypothetical protein [Pseudomonadota bacterium]